MRGVLLAAAGTMAFFASHASVMRIPAQMEVGPDGSLHYAVPIEVPPGVAGLAPHLALTYGSQRGNGIAGLGWSLDGLGAITRCPRTVAQDGFRGAVAFDAQDRFCMDGERLMQVTGSVYGADGTEYRTERDSFTRVVSYGSAGSGPAWFRAWTKSGLTLDFGNTADAAVEAQGKSTIRIWALSRIQDTKGNHLAISYLRDVANGAYYPARVDYAGAGEVPAQAVELVYDAPGTRLDQTPGYHAGSLVKTIRRLKQIRTLSGGALVQSTELVYLPGEVGKPSRVGSIRRCGASGDCLPDITFSWSGWNLQPGSPVALSGHWDLEQVALLAGDFNGDGRTDFLRQVSGGWGGGGALYLSNGEGTFATTTFTGAWHREYVLLTLGDFDGDGKTDFIRQVPAGWGGGASLHLSKGDGTFTVIDLGIGWETDSVQLVTGDFNGDGKTDFIRHVSAAWGGTASVYFSNGNGTFATSALAGRWDKEWIQVTVGDMNGDGKSDLVVQTPSGWGGAGTLYLSRGDGAFDSLVLPGQWDRESVRLVSGDFNGDGKSDFIRQVSTGWGGLAVVYISKGDGTFTTSGLPGAWDLESVSLVGGDFNGDGRTDLLRQTVTGWGGVAEMHLSAGDGTFVASPLNGRWDREALSIVAGDFDGDGRTDFLRQFINGWGGGAELMALGPTPGPVDTVTSIASAGLLHAITYEPLTDASVYTKTTTSVPNAILLHVPSYVVASVAASNGIGGTNTTRYAYGDLAADPSTGRGLLGFRWSKSYDETTGMELTRTYRQDYPFVGLTEKVEQRQMSSSPSVLLARSTTSYQQTTGSGANTVFVFASQVVEESWDLTGLALPTFTTTYTYAQSPQYGDPTQVSVASGDGSVKTTVNEYQPPATTGGTWIIGRLRKARVQSTKP